MLRDPSRLADERWYDGSIFAELTKDLTVWANLFCSDFLAIGQTRWHAYGPMIYGYLSGPAEDWPSSLARRLENRMASKAGHRSGAPERYPYTIGPYTCHLVWPIARTSEQNRLAHKQKQRRVP